MTKPIDQLGFIISLAGKEYFYGERTSNEQQVLDSSISHMQSFNDKIGNTILFKMLALDFKKFTNILDLSQALASKNFVAFVNSNTFYINGNRNGYLYLPTMYAEPQIKKLLEISSFFNELTNLNIYRVNNNFSKTQIASLNREDLDELINIRKAILSGFYPSNSFARK